VGLDFLKRGENFGREGGLNSSERLSALIKETQTKGRPARDAGETLGRKPLVVKGTLSFQNLERTLQNHPV